jgi:uncharacterized membrane protein
VVTEPTRREDRRRTLERITAFTDAAVAIALTLLVLPLVDEADADVPLVDEFRANSGDLVGFAVSFLVIAQFWGGHRRLYEQLDDYDEGLLAINTFWLLTVVFLPYPTARLFVESHLERDSAVFYLASMLAISLLAFFQAWYVARHQHLVRPGMNLSVRDLLRPTVLVCGTFVLAIILAFVNPQIGLYSLILLWPAQAIGHRRRTARVQRSDMSS